MAVGKKGVELPLKVLIIAFIIAIIILIIFIAFQKQGIIQLGRIWEEKIFGPAGF